MSKISPKGYAKLFNIIHHYGTPQKATTLNNEKAERKDALWVPEWLALVPVTPYDEHFVYENKVKDQPSYMCTCGSAAGVVPPDPSLGHFVCLFHKAHGHHQGSSVWQ